VIEMRSIGTTRWDNYVLTVPLLAADRRVVLGKAFTRSRDAVPGGSGAAGMAGCSPAQLDSAPRPAYWWASIRWTYAFAGDGLGARRAL